MRSYQWVDTLLEISSKPLTMPLDLLGWALGSPAHERASHQLAISVFDQSHLRSLDSRSSNQSISAGDILRVQRDHYNHYAVYCGAGRVVHYTGIDGDLGSGLSIRETDLMHFHGNADRFDVLKFSKSKRKFLPDDIVARARCRVGEREYDLLSHNCQHFAFWCATGKSVSGQTPFRRGLDVQAQAALGLGGILRVPDLIWFYGASVDRVIFSATVDEK